MAKLSRRTLALAWLAVLALGPPLGPRAGAQPSGPMSGQTLAAAGAVTLAGETTRVALLPSVGATSLQRQLADLGQQRPLFLVLDDLQASDQPGVIYEVYVGLPPGPVPTSDDRHYVGTLNFFAVAPPNSVRRSRSYNVTALVPTLLSQGAADGGIAVTIVARAGSPSASSGPATIGRVALVAQ